MNPLSIAALLRGLCINLSGRPQFVIQEETGVEKIPPEVMGVEISDGENEESTAEIVRHSYEAWEKSIARNLVKHASGRGQIGFIGPSAHRSQAPMEGSETLLPAAAALFVNRKPKALYWIDGDLDSARERSVNKDAAPRKEKPIVSGSPSQLITAEERTSLVKNKIALVTGGAQGIGEDIARNLAASGALVLIADLKFEVAGKLARKINTEEGRTAAIAVEVNVSDEVSVEKMFNTIVKTVGGLDLCVSCAGVYKNGSVLEQEIKDFKFVTDNNYTGFFIISKHSGRLMRLQHLTAPSWKTDIVQINSKSGLSASNKKGAYSGSNSGSLGLVVSFARELMEYNIKVNAICPGNFLDSPLWADPEKGLLVQYLKAGKVPGAETIADVRSFYEAKVPMKRGCTGKDLMRALYYAVEQEYETGQAIPVTGGEVMY